MRLINLTQGISMLLIATFLLSPCSSIGLPAAAQDQPIKPVQTAIPFTTLTAWPAPLIDVTVNGTITATLLVDTGTNFSAITDTLAAQIGLTPQPYLQNGKPYQVLGKPAKAVTLMSLDIGKFTFQNQRMLTLSGDDLTGLAKQPVQGIIGLDLLQHFAVEFDFTEHQISLRFPGHLSPSQLAAAGFAQADSVPLTQQANTDEYMTPIQLQNGKQMGQEDLMIDTGSGVTSISHSLATSLALTPLPTPEFTATLHGRFAITPAIAPIFQLATLLAPNVTVVFPDSDDAGYNPLLGVDFLSQYTILLDFPAKTMLLLAPPPPGG